MRASGLPPNRYADRRLAEMTSLTPPRVRSLPGYASDSFSPRAGLIVSEYGPGTEPAPCRFPARKRLRRAVNEIPANGVVASAVAAFVLRGREVPVRFHRTTTAAASFFLETMSAFEMVRRGYRDTRDAALFERRQAALLRRLSNFLTDASVAAGGCQSHHELLQLVAEQALELIDAQYAVASASINGEQAIVAFAVADGTHPQVVPTWVTTANAQLPSHTTAQASAADASAGDIPRNALTAPLKALDGRTIGSVQLFNRRDGEFTDIDQAMLTHLAELTAAALERTQLYAKP